VSSEAKPVHTLLISPFKLSSLLSVCSVLTQHEVSHLEALFPLMLDGQPVPTEICQCSWYCHFFQQSALLFKLLLTTSNCHGIENVEKSITLTNWDSHLVQRDLSRKAPQCVE
jgi:hypothetical protein